MNLLSETKTLIEDLEKIKKNLSIGSRAVTPSGSIFNSLEVRKNSLASEKLNIDSHQDLIAKVIVTKPKKYHFRVVFIKDSIKFLDLRTILNLSLVNKEFSFFIKSIYFYKFISSMRKPSKLERNKKEDKTKAVSKGSNKGLLGNMVGALGTVLGFSANKDKKKDKPINPKLLEAKVNTYEGILHAKLKNIDLSNEIKDLREVIDGLILKRIKNKESNNKISNLLNFNHILKDEEIEKIKRDKMEKEYENLLAEVNSLKNEQFKLKDDLTILQKEDIDMEKVLTSLNIYIKNNLKVEDIKITPTENLRSGKYGDLDSNVSTIALYNSYVDK